MDSITALLEEYGAKTRDYVKTYIQKQPSSPYLHELISDYPSRGGKMMRPSICIANARAFGAELDEILPFAGAIEILHNALLIHDDIQDESLERRGQPTLHALHGVPLAINAGDAMLMLALGPLLDRHASYGGYVAQQILAITQRMARETAEGQALEIGWREADHFDVNTADYLTMVLKKTAWMATIWPAQIGILIGSNGTVDPMNVARFGFFVGAAFQIQDDLLNLQPDRNYGKEINGDLYEAKRTLMLIHLRDNCTPDERFRLDSILARQRHERHADDIEWMAELLHDRGSIDHARTVARSLAGAALHEFSLAYGHLPDSADKRFIHDLIPWIFNH